MLSVVLLGLSLFLWYALRQPALPEGVVSGNGRIEATEYDIAAKQAGRLDSVFVNEGDMVVAGRTLARMNEDEPPLDPDADLGQEEGANPALARGSADRS